MLRVHHAHGQTTYPTESFSVDPASAVLLVYADGSQKRVVAAFNREVWGYVEFIEPTEDGEPDGDEV